MATTITPGTLTVTHTEVVVLTDGTNDHGISLTNTFTLGSITTVKRAIVPVVNGDETGIMSFATNTVTAVPVAFSEGYVLGHFDQDDVVYIRFTNLDDANHVALKFRNVDDDEFAVLLDFGQTYIYGCDRATGVVATMNASATALSSPPALADLEDITAEADSGAVDLEVVVVLD